MSTSIARFVTTAAIAASVLVTVVSTAHAVAPVPEGSTPTLLAAAVPFIVGGLVIAARRKKR